MTFEGRFCQFVKHVKENEVLNKIQRTTGGFHGKNWKIPGGFKVDI
jgi:hypothetical protein